MLFVSLSKVTIHIYMTTYWHTKEGFKKNEIWVNFFFLPSKTTRSLRHRLTPRSLHEPSLIPRVGLVTVRLFFSHENKQHLEYCKDACAYCAHKIKAFLRRRGCVSMGVGLHCSCKGLFLTYTRVILINE